MLILKITNPEGKSIFVTGAFPSACGKTNLAMLVPTIPGWKVETIGDDIAWMKFGKDGRLYAINPEAGFFGVAPGTSEKSNYNAMMAASKNTIFTNCALTEDNDVWWEGIGYDAPGNHRLDEQRGPRKRATRLRSPPPTRTPASPLLPAGSLDRPRVGRSEGCSDQRDFGGRRPKTIPLVHQSRDWNHGVFPIDRRFEITAAAPT